MPTPFQFSFFFFLYDSTELSKSSENQHMTMKLDSVVLKKSNMLTKYIKQIKEKIKLFPI